MGGKVMGLGTGAAGCVTGAVTGWLAEASNAVLLGEALEVDKIVGSDVRVTTGDAVGEPAFGGGVSTAPIACMIPLFAK